MPHTYPVDKTELLARLQENLEKHVAEYTDALAAWKIAATTALAEAAERAQADGEITLNPLKDLPKPSSYSESYKDAIERVKWNKEDVLALDNSEFAAWVQDNWSWSGAFVANSTQYVGRSA